MLFILNLFMRQLHHQLHTVDAPHICNQFGFGFFARQITFGQPQVIEVLELGQQVFSIKKIFVQVVEQGPVRLTVLVNRKKVVPVFFVELDFQFIVDPEVKPERLVELPHKLVRLHRRHNSQQERILEKLFGQLVVVNFQFHGVKVVREGGS